MIKLIYIGVGGFMGSISRYLVSGAFYKITKSASFPFGTLAVNVLGCLFIGFLSGLAEDRHLFNPEIRLFLFIGFLGGFTTFSTFGLEVLSFLRDGQFMSSFLNLILHLILGFGAVWMGFSLSKLF
jgi:CrcB protein